MCLVSHWLSLYTVIGSPPKSIVRAAASPRQARDGGLPPKPRVAGGVRKRQAHRPRQPSRRGLGAHRAGAGRLSCPRPAPYVSPRASRGPANLPPGHRADVGAPSKRMTAAPTPPGHRSEARGDAGCSARGRGWRMVRAKGARTPQGSLLGHRPRRLAVARRGAAPRAPIAPAAVSKRRRGTGRTSAFCAGRAPRPRAAPTRRRNRSSPARCAARAGEHVLAPRALHEDRPLDGAGGREQLAVQEAPPSVRR
jgi:hypothetical protein